VHLARKDLLAAARLPLDHYRNVGIGKPDGAPELGPRRLVEMGFNSIRSPERSARRGSRGHPLECSEEPGAFRRACDPAFVEAVRMTREEFAKPPRA
jgi:hypothetical protein